MSYHHHSRSDAIPALDDHGYPMLLAPGDTNRPPRSAVPDAHGAVIVHEGEPSPAGGSRRFLARRGRRPREDARPAGSKTLAGVAAHLGLTPEQVEEYARFGQAVLTAKRAMSGVMAAAAENVPERTPEDRA